MNASRIQPSGPFLDFTEMREGFIKFPTERRMILKYTSHRVESSEGICPGNKAKLVLDKPVL